MFEFENDEIDAVETLDSVEFRPTLVIGLGGTGHEVVARLKARFLETFGPDIFKIVKLLVFDTAQETVSVASERGTDVTLTQDTELVNIGDVPVADLLNNLNRHPTIEACLPADELRRGFSVFAGFKWNRPLARLAFFYHFNHNAKIQDRLQSAIQALGNIKLRGPVGGKGEIVIPKSRGINVFIINSLCGGTGSGTFLDMAYLVRQLIKDSGIPEEYCFVNGFLVLPGAFAKVGGDRIMAYAYAALRELEYFSGEGRFVACYPGGREIAVRSRPFNICYLVDAVNEQGKLLSGMGELAPITVESIFGQITCQVGHAMMSLFDNVKSTAQWATDQDGKEVPTCFSSLGISALVFPAQPIINTCAYEFGYEFIGQGLLRAADEKATDEMAARFVVAQELLPKPLFMALAADTEAGTITVKLSATPLANVEDKELLRRLGQMLANYESQKLNRDFRRAVEQNAERLKKSVSQAIAQETQRLVDDSRCGPCQARAFLEQVSARFVALINACAQERGQIQERQLRLIKGQPALNKALSDAITSFVIGRGKRIAKARDAYVRSKEAEFSAAFDVQTRNAAMRLFTDLRAVVDRQVKEVSALIDKLEQVQERFQNTADKLKQDRGLPLMSTDIASRDDVNAYYQENKREVEEELVRFVSELDSLYAWSERHIRTIARDIFDFVRQPFLPIANEKIEQIIEQKQEQASAEQRLQDLRDGSAPLWTYNPARLDSNVDLESIVVISVEDRTGSIFWEHTLPGEYFTTTLDPHQITVLHTKHGLPLFALTQIDAWAKKYENHVNRDLSPLHLFPNLPWLQDIEQGKQFFALGQAFGYITKKGIWYYCQRKDEGEDDAQLGHGLETVIERLLSNTALLEEVEEMIREKIEDELTGEQAAVIIYNYENRPLSPGPQAQAELELREAAGRFREEMGWSQDRVKAAKAKLEQGNHPGP